MHGVDAERQSCTGSPGTSLGLLKGRTFAGSPGLKVRCRSNSRGVRGRLSFAKTVSMASGYEKGVHRLD
eukprot:3779126-Amphidinium_carterae.1